jgi:hypothetical protein
MLLTVPSRAGPPPGYRPSAGVALLSVPWLIIPPPAGPPPARCPSLYLQIRGAVVEKLGVQEVCNPIRYPDKDLRATEPFAPAGECDELSLALQDVDPSEILAHQVRGIDEQCVLVALGSMGKREYAKQQDGCIGGLGGLVPRAGVGPGICGGVSRPRG